MFFWLLWLLHHDRRFQARRRLLAMGAVLLLSSCDPGTPRDSSISADVQSGKSEEKPLVLTTFTVLADMARNVAGDRLNVRSIVKQGSEVHGYQPTPSDLEEAAQADLIVENGFGLELWARKFTAAAGTVPILNLTDGMQPLLIESDVYSGKPNPHAWMSPQRALQYVDRMVDGFSQLDPDSAEIFFKNGEIYKKKLQVLDDELRSSLALIPEHRRMLVTCEGAFSYLAHDYGMKEAYLWPVNAESQVTPRRMADLINTVREQEVPTIFCESTVSDKPQREVALASGAQFGGTFFVDSLSSADGPAPTLLELQRHNVRLIREGLMPQGESN